MDLSLGQSQEMLEVLRAYGRLQEAFFDETARVFMEMSLTMAQFRALATIRRYGRTTGRELAGRLKVTPGTLVPLVDRLEEQGFVRRVPDHDDRRITWLDLTHKAERLFHRLWFVGAAKMVRAVGRMPAADRAQLKRLLHEIAGGIEGEPTAGVDATDAHGILARLQTADR